MRVVFQFILLGVLLIAAPYASWHYLSKGVDYRQSRLAQMGLFGHIPSFTYSDGLGGTHSTDTWEGKVTLLGIPMAASVPDEPLLEALNRMQEQFAEREDVQVLLWMDEDVEPAGSGDSHIPLVVASRTVLEPLIHRSELEGIRESQAVILLFDVRKELRQFYQAGKPDDLRRLAEHTAILMPPQRISKPQVQREPEK